ncbi:SDR family NAD(P)-dependent oxidoreductase [Sphingomonas sp. CD22]|uniref:SDR family NAD(P)-dependent oxidoreductase n=1 Tax=Sphingomonas sp. CD22 TaxID=3100214 RepID=UPI002ADFB62C|nr:SDR family NAD(P)-dependent oxidoreductase [Sphingomonas sp. CD22]MEA1086184.1 SDR family NAD(P)-dependent oxidoreductase [Sphingomonas sp. CD22]
MSAAAGAFAPGAVAVITGAAGGIGLATARRFAREGMRLCLVDREQDALDAAVATIAGDAIGMACDVSDRQAVEALAADVATRFGAVSVLMNNAGVGGGGDALSSRDGWDRLLGVNLFGVLNGVQAFVPAMIAHGGPAVVINTGSKQGITQPPGDTAYNVSKSAVKALTEGLAHTLRTQTGDRVAAHLLVPGFTWTGMTARGRSEQPPGAWSPDQVVDFMMTGIAAGDFYLICPDNETTSEQDRRRIAWAAGDLIENRPALSRWHPDHAAAFAAYMEDGR